MNFMIHFFKRPTNIILIIITSMMLSACKDYPSYEKGKEQNSKNTIHKAVKNGTEYSKTLNIESVYAANTSIIDIHGKLYLLTDRLMEIDKIIDFDKLTKKTYQIRDSNWE